MTTLRLYTLSQNEDPCKGLRQIRRVRNRQRIIARARTIAFGSLCLASSNFVQSRTRFPPSTSQSGSSVNIVFSSVQHASSSLNRFIGPSGTTHVFLDLNGMRYLFNPDRSDRLQAGSVLEIERHHAIRHSNCLCESRAIRRSSRQSRAGRIDLTLSTTASGTPVGSSALSVQI